MDNYLVFDSDDFGATHVISDMCQSHDCRDMLNIFKAANPNFKATLFAIPGEMTLELSNWALQTEWVELAVHGFYHYSNYECENWTYKDMDDYAKWCHDLWGASFVEGFKAPGWQISDGIYEWLKEHHWWVADQEYNDHRRPEGLKVYKVGDSSIHTHTWDCVGNGVYELEEQILERIKGVEDFRFISEVVQ